MTRYKTFFRYFSYPFVAYNHLLEKHPLPTKCLTSGVMYSGGDLIAQICENYQSKDRSELFEISWRRAFVFFTFGNLIAGRSKFTMFLPPYV